MNGDFSVPPVEINGIEAHHPHQLTLTPSGSNRYIALNTRKPPFDRINVRRAVIANANRVALRNTRGDARAGPPRNALHTA